jgi:hypothetical protein
VARGSERGERIVAIMFAKQFPVQRALQSTAQCYTVVGIDLPALIRAEALHRSPAAALKHAIQRGLTAIADDQASAGDCAHQMVKLRFYRREIGKNVGMIELQIVKYRGTRMVVDELGTLVKKCGVVFVRLDGKEW